MNEQEETQKSREEKAREVLLKVAKWELGAYPECIDQALTEIAEIIRGMKKNSQTIEEMLNEPEEKKADTITITRSDWELIKTIVHKNT